MDRRKIDIIVTSILIVASIIILTNDGLSEGGVETDLGSLFIPRIVAGLIIVYSLTIGIQAILKLKRKAELETVESISTDGFLGVNIYVGIFIAYWFLVPYIGFLLITPFVMLAIAVLLGGRNWLALGAMSIFTPLIIFYGAIHFLRVYLPTWSLT